MELALRCLFPGMGREAVDQKVTQILGNPEIGQFFAQTFRSQLASGRPMLFMRPVLLQAIKLAEGRAL